MTAFLLLLSATLHAADPYASSGFLSLPSEAGIGALSAVECDRKGGRIYVLHRGEKPLLQFDSKGKYLKGWGTGLFKVAHGLRVDRQGNVWTTDNGNHVLRKFSRDGQLLQTIGEEGVAGRDEKHFRSPDDIVFSSKGEMYVADSGNGRIVRLGGDGRYIGEWGKKGKAQGEFATAHGLAIDAGDRIYVADRGNNRVQVFDREGRFVSEWKGFGNPFGLLVVGRELLVSDGDANRISHIGMDGAVASAWGDANSLKLPHLMSTDRKGNLYVAEVNGKRVQIFQPAKNR
ncbi:MAG: peptidyl-alpha-hydroxyglycine alpha-amidating lyase family protein [Bryobacteraceae bacterium]|nr:peptidyl-alpha-hydroxyglycine alpha-amidating lyase family protein [Bryobacteraceae bacterium]